MALPTELGKRIRKRREELKLGRGDLGLPGSTVAGIENGDTHSFGHDSLIPIVKRLQTTADWLLGLRSEPPGPDQLPDLLPPREWTLLQAFRAATPRERTRLEDFVAGLAPGKNKKRSGRTPFKKDDAAGQARRPPS